jgi:hypothetical protein
MTLHLSQSQLQLSSDRGLSLTGRIASLQLCAQTIRLDQQFLCRED